MDVKKFCFSCHCYSLHWQEKANLQHIEIYLIIQEMGLICLGVGYADENKITCAFEIVRKVTAL